MIRITGGEARGRRLKVPPGRHVRPTSDRVRQAIFNILGGRVPGSRVLDLFAGSGVMGLEALSRGAKYAVFIEINRRVAAILDENISILGYSDRCQVLRQDVFKAVPAIAGDGWEGLIFADPPYGQGLFQSTVKLTAPLLRPGGCLIVEHHINEAIDVEVVPGNVSYSDQRRYGLTMVSFFVAIG